MPVCGLVMKLYVMQLLLSSRRNATVFILSFISIIYSGSLDDVLFSINCRIYKNKTIQILEN